MNRIDELYNIKVDIKAELDSWGVIYDKTKFKFFEDITCDIELYRDAFCYACEQESIVIMDRDTQKKYAKDFEFFVNLNYAYLEKEYCLPSLIDLRDLYWNKKWSETKTGRITKERNDNEFINYLKANYGLPLEEYELEYDTIKQLIKNLLIDRNIDSLSETQAREYYENLREIVLQQIAEIKKQYEDNGLNYELDKRVILLINESGFYTNSEELDIDTIKSILKNAICPRTTATLSVEQVSDLLKEYKELDSKIKKYDQIRKKIMEFQNDSISLYGNAYYLDDIEEMYQQYIVCGALVKELNEKMKFLRKINDISSGEGLPKFEFKRKYHISLKSLKSFVNSELLREVNTIQDRLYELESESDESLNKLQYFITNYISYINEEVLFLSTEGLGEDEDLFYTDEEVESISHEMVNQIINGSIKGISILDIALRHKIVTDIDQKLLDFTTREYDISLMINRSGYSYNLDDLSFELQENPNNSKVISCEMLDAAMEYMDASSSTNFLDSAVKEHATKIKKYH